LPLTSIDLFDAARQASNRLNLGCSENCGHSVLEHNAFDFGVECGEEDNYENPYHSPDLREAWETGFSLGICLRQS
jgi:hypothetical protein